MIKEDVIDGRPYVSCFVFVPRIAVGGEVRFLIDTGADTTTLQVRDALRLGVRHATDFAGQSPVVSVSVGGQTEEFVEPCFLLMIHEDGKLDRLLLPVHFSRRLETREPPSLLGRDVISYYRLVFEQRANLVTLDSLSPQS